tara:strand:- start:95 stop:544 length:450 start_codon:yes stop_codon:yes gene_type:complete
MPRYYHATPKENLGSILRHGIQAHLGYIYCSTSEETSARWICFTRRGSKEIITISFNRPDGDKRMQLGTDHSPLMTKFIGVNEEGASFVSTETIPPKDIDLDNIMVWKNPFYSVEYEKEMERVKNLRKDMLADIGASMLKDAIFGSEEE